MGLYSTGPSESDNGGLDREQDDPGWFANGVNTLAKGGSRLFSGNNDWTAPIPTMNAEAPGSWTEAEYQNALNIYNQLPYEQKIAMGGPPKPPEASPRVANINLQREVFNPYLASLAQAAQGKGPSQAQDALREGTATTVASQYGMAATPSVGGAAGAALVANAQNNAGAAMQTGARQGSMLRAQEMTDARQQLGQALNQQQGTNLNTSQLQFQREKANQDATMGINTLNQKTGQENRGGIAGLWSSLSDIRAKDDIHPMDPYGGFKSSIPTQSALSPYGQPGAASPNYMPQIEPTAAPAAAPPQEDEGFISKIFSDEHSKEKIRHLEDVNTSLTNAIAGTSVQYPQLGEAGLNLARKAPAADDRLGMVTPPLAREPASFDAPARRQPVAANFARFGAPGGYKEAETFADLTSPAGSRSALGPVAPYEYRYKPEFAARVGEDTTPRAGIMAQDLEKSPNPALRSAVVDTPIGKAIDGKRAISANLALSAGLDKRLRNIEQGMRAPVSYPNPAAPSLVMSDENSKETIRVLSDALAQRPAQPSMQPVATGPRLFPEDARLVTPMDDSERKIARMKSGAVDPYAAQRGQIESASTAPSPQQLPRWANDYKEDEEYALPGAMPAPRFY